MHELKGTRAVEACLVRSLRTFAVHRPGDPHGRIISTSYDKDTDRIDSIAS